MCASRVHAHAQQGARSHDAGCWALGIPLAEIRRELRARDPVGAASLLEEAVHEAVAELSAYGRAWTAAAATESLAYALRRRITPSRSTSGDGGAAA